MFGKVSALSWNFDLSLYVGAVRVTDYIYLFQSPYRFTPLLPRSFEVSGTQAVTLPKSSNSHPTQTGQYLNSQAQDESYFLDTA